jgi:hypothetical protein
VHPVTARARTAAAAAAARVEAGFFIVDFLVVVLCMEER